MPLCLRNPVWQKSKLTTVSIFLPQQAVYSGMRYEVNISAAKCDGTGVTFGTINNCTITLSLPAGASIITRHFSADL
ncbi:hypothetical protein ACH54_24605 [Salmonella enterica subsp. enterica serovar Infantis]|nr:MULTISPECIES: hypothetical protein [Salmonella]KNB22352.1 hypothetical protein ACH56_17805 [Salmonella enterica subsp. enterica serovar Infantis]KNB23618.1 hypothetical protein ACH54_24605 [Salmonella enterica subsp. enterica serovar Infantis]